VSQVKEPSEFQAIQARQYQSIVSALRESIGESPRLAPPEARMARLAVEGRDVHEIASEVRMSEEAVWRFLQNLADSLTGRRRGTGYETGGLGADTDPGVTGGYGDTGFGAIGNEPLSPVSEEGEFLQRELVEGLEERPDHPRAREQ
jgi:hypothetical protein